MKKNPNTTRRSICWSAALSALAVFSTATLSAATNAWLGTNGVNWSESSNWTNGVPVAGDDLRFLDSGITNVPGAVNNVVDAGISAGSIHFGNTNNAHNTEIPSGVVLGITNTGSLTMYTPTEAPVSKLITNSISGSGTLVISNSSARIALNQGSATAPSRASLNLSGLDTLDITARNLGLGSSFSPNPAGVNTRYGGQLFLAKTNTISLSLTDTLANYQTLTSRTNAIEIVRAPGNNPGITCQLWLGQTNNIFLDSLGCGMDKSGNNSTASSGLIAFNPAFTNNSPGAYFRGVGGAAATRVQWWSIGDGNNSSSSSNGGRGTNDFSNGTVDLLVDVMSLARECNAANTGWAGPHAGLLTFNRGVVDVNTIYAGNQRFTQPTSVPGTLGIIIVNGSEAQLRVNSALNLGYTTGTSPTALKTSGILNIQGGTALVNQINVGAASTTNRVILNGGSLILSNTIASPAKGLLSYATTNATLQVSVTGITNIVTTNLVVGGASNVISAPNVAVFATYPRQIPLIKYTALSGAYNFVLDPATLSGAAPDAYLSNNVANSSIDIVLPTDPRPVITSTPNNFASAPGVDVALAATYTGVAPLTAQWLKDSVALTDGPTGSGSILAGVTTPTLSITNAQDTDSGAYVIVVTNLYGVTTSAPPASVTISTNDIAPIVSGPFNQTVIQSNNATFTASVSGNPAPFIQWQKDGTDISGANSASVTITNAQYPTDEGTYSIIVTNVAGSLTNSATLTVIVPPVITAQPVDLTVTNGQPASFSVTATGIPAPNYQWLKNGSPMANQTNATLNFGAVTATDIATYAVSVTNLAGSVTSTNVTLTVLSTMSATTFSPSNGAANVFYDTPLTITFSQPPSLRSAGTIKVYAATNGTMPIDTINLAQGGAQQRTFPGDGQSFTYNTVVISGNSATIYPHFNTLSSNQTYYVTIDTGVFTDASGAYFGGIADTNTWSFTTKPTGPANPTNIVVAANGSGDFLTVQGALNSIAAGNTNPSVINVRNGLYTEIVNISGKHNITLRGQSRLGTLIGYANNANFQAANSGTTHARMSFKVNANDIAIESLTLTNMTPQGGSQAEALMIASNAKRCIVHNAEVISRQDTILGNESSSQGYFYKSTVRGNFDYIWGGGNFYFDDCTIHTLSGAGGGILTAARTGTSATSNSTYPWANPGGTYTANGMSFVGCTLTVDSGVGSIPLAGGNGTAGNLVSWAFCSFATNYATPSAGLFSGNFLFWQHQNTDLSNNPVSFSALTTLPDSDARLLAATNIPTWFYGWVPQLAPNILTNPANVTVTAGQPASFTVTATGIPDPTYQWLRNGTNITDATNATYTIASTVLSDADSYSVVVTTSAGSVTSSAATLTVNPPPNSAPTFTAPNAGTNINVNPGVVLSVTNTATDSDVPAQTLTYTLLTGPTNASVNAASGELTWRPLVTQADSVNPISVVATDDGTPALSATNSYTITVGSLLPIGVSSAVTAPGQLTLTITAAVGPDYAVEVSTNLTSWSTLFTTNAPPSPFTWDADTTASPLQFYRIKAGPPLP